jgi:plasmid stabilization system protein ParE
MALSIEFGPEARADFDAAYDWYADRSLAAAIGFASEVDVAIEAIAAAPDRFVRTYAGCRSCRLKRYPYCIVYHQVEDVIHVIAVAHAKRRPGFWSERTQP